MLRLKEVTLAPPAALLAARGLGQDGTVQRGLARAAADFCAPYVPYKTGALKGSVVMEQDGFSYTVPYAKKQYYEGKEGAMRGRLWFARMKADRVQELCGLAAGLCGGEQRL